MFEEIIKQLEGIYTQEDLEILLQHEQILQFNEFDDYDVLNLGNLLASIVFEWNEQAAVQIIRESDELAIYQFVSSEKAQRNIDFITKKRIATKQTGHSSFWVLVKHCLDKDQDEVFNAGALPFAGAFPIYVNHEYKYTIGVSGMHEGKDYLLIINGLCEYLDVKVTAFKKQII